jgi:hypothetical protein
VPDGSDLITSPATPDASSSASPASPPVSDPQTGFTAGLFTREALRLWMIIGVMINFAAPDLTQHPPRSPRVRLGGYVHLPRLLDKARAYAAGKNGEYHFNCPLDRHFFEFTGIDHEAFLAEVKAGKTDAQVLEWVRAHSTRQQSEIFAWSAWLEQNGPGGEEGHEWFAEVLKTNHSARDDIRSISDMLDFDDYLSFGGKA